MKKTVAITLSLLLMLTAVPVLADSNPVHITIDEERVIFPSAQPYADGETVMLPIRFILEHLSVSVNWNGATNEVVLSKNDEVHALQLQNNTAHLTGSSTTYVAALRDGRLFLPYSVITDLYGYEADYNPAINTVAIVTSADSSHSAKVKLWVNEVIHAFIADDFDKVYSRFDENMTAAVSLENLESGWTSVAASFGEFKDIAIKQQSVVEKLDVVAALVTFSEVQLQFNLVFHSDGRIASISFSYKYEHLESELPTGLQEETIVIGKNTDYPLEGTLTMPSNVTGSVPAVVLVHGSGANDRDSTAFSYKPFRDIAWTLAENGIAVLRYDKRTFVYGEQLAATDMKKFTVAQESVEDAVHASNWLKQDDRIDASQVYIIGHSLGGMLAPRIDAAGGDFAGLILLAGTPRTLWEVMYDQNVAAIEAMDLPENMRASYLEAINNEFTRAQQLQEITDDEAQQSVIFNVPAYYLKEMDSYDAAGIAAELQKPIFILQGETDFQVYADVDYVLWQQLLKDVKEVTYALYPGLNHFFIVSEGDAIGTIQEYQTPGHVDEGVLQDIAEWIWEQGAR